MAHACGGTAQRRRQQAGPPTAMPTSAPMQNYSSVTISLLCSPILVPGLSMDMDPNLSCSVRMLMQCCVRDSRPS